MSIGDALGYFVFGLFAVLIVGVVFIFRQRIAQQAEAQRLADAAFEAQVLHAVTPAPAPAGAQPSISPFVSDSQAMASALFDDMPIPAAEAVPARVAPPTSATDDAYRQPADVTCAAVIQQMRSAGIVNDVDGYLEMHGNAKGAVVLRMKGGKHALLLPYFETEPFALRNLRRYEMIIQVGRNGKAVVLRSLEEVIASKVAGNMF